VPSDNPHTTIVFDRELLEWVGDFRFEHRLADRSAAIMWLPRWAKGHNPEPPMLKGRVGTGE